VGWDGDRVVTASNDGTITVRSASAHPFLLTQTVLRGHQSLVNAVAVSSRCIVSGSSDGDVRVRFPRRENAHCSVCVCVCVCAYVYAHVCVCV
jgi:WD40 repeat protein